jgi:hypothetical protein
LSIRHLLTTLLSLRTAKIGHLLGALLPFGTAKVWHLLRALLPLRSSHLVPLLAARHLPHRLATFHLLRPLLLSLLLSARVHLVHHLLTTSFLLLAHLLHHLTAIGPLLTLGLLWALLSLPTAHLLLSLLRGRPFLPLLLLPTTSCLRLRALLTLRLRALLALRLLTLNLGLSASPVSSAISAAITSAAALAEKVAIGSDQRHQPQCGHRR